MVGSVTDIAKMNAAYGHARRDLLALFDVTGVGELDVLDIGCANGATSIDLKRMNPMIHVTGIESDDHLARLAATQLDEVLTADAGELLPALAAADCHFDLVLCGDVLEHLADPVSALSNIRSLCPDGTVLVSLPNVAFWSTHVALLRGTWPQRDRGIFDRTHLRFFGRNDLSALAERTGFAIDFLTFRYRLVESPHRLNARFERFIRHVPVVRSIFVHQFLLRLR